MKSRSALLLTTSASAVLSAVLILFVFVLPTLPGRLDEILLTNNLYCHENIAIQSEERDGSGGKIHIDYGAYVQKINVDKNNRRETKTDSSQDYHFSSSSVWRNLSLDYILWRLALYYLRDSGANEGRDGAYFPSTIHPLCGKYRRFRSRLRVQNFLLPWNWYHRCTFQLRGLNLRAPSKISFSSRRESSTFHLALLAVKPLQRLWKFLAASIVGYDSYTDELRVNIDHTYKLLDRKLESTEENYHKHNHLPPALEVEYVDVSFRSWSKPIISVQMHGVNINVVFQKGAAPIQLTLQLPGYGKQNERQNVCHIEEEIDDAANTAVLIGDMTIPEVLKLLPKPPEVEGLYPRIGVVNITNVTISFFSNDVDSPGANDVKNSKSPLSLVVKVGVPNEIFSPVLNVTNANKSTGIDQMHFQPLLEASYVTSLRDHLFHEAEEALRSSWTKATEFTENIKGHTTKAQEQLRELVVKTQELYLDRWVEIGLRTWHHTHENLLQGLLKLNGTVPLIKAFENWTDDLIGMISEPISPLKIVALHHWNTILETFSKHHLSLFIDATFWDQYLNQLKHAVDDAIAASLEKATNHNWFPDLPIEQKITNHLTEMKAALDDFIYRSTGVDVHHFLESIEREMREKWLEISLDSMFFE